MHEELHAPLIDIGFRARELDDVITRLVPALIAAGWTPPADTAPQAGVVIPPERTEYPRDPAGSRELAQPPMTSEAWPTGTVHPEVTVLATTTGSTPTRVTGAVAGPQGCTHQFRSGKWCALPEGHEPPHVPAATFLRGGA